ncbi:secretin receptor-like isoform X2 [Lineus longissimus]|uniref:secretin receptor-like isoform X2 n=1 Tax=Lineus longissimus TaxID=88925 RepID=UPI00315D5EF8
MRKYKLNWIKFLQQVLASWILLRDVVSSETVYVSEETQDRRISEELALCVQRIRSEESPADGDVYCDLTWDGLVCWGYTPAGTTASKSCPDYVNKFDPGAKATRICMPDGKWYEHPSFNKTWTNFTECYADVNNNKETNISDFMKYHMANIRLMTDVGYGISLISLITAVIIMLAFRRLHCARNTIHVHLFFSFIFRSSMSLMKDNLLVEGLGFPSDVTYTATGNLLFLSDRSHWECKLFFTVFNYSLIVNYAWILVEGCYLHTLLYVVVYTENSSILWFVLAGWALPLLSILPWVIVRAELEDKFCWNVHHNVGYFWILKGPIVLTIVINFVFFIRIVRILFTKLVAANNQEARKFRPNGMKLAKSTLVLIPLFGVHYIIFIGLPEKFDERAEVTKLYFELFFNSFQGLFVATLFCFMNGEVKAEILKKWQRYQLQRTGGNLNFSHSMKMSTYSTYVQRHKNSPTGSQNDKADLTAQQHNGHTTSMTPPLLGGQTTNNYYSN